MISGIRNCSKLLNIPLKVMNTLTTGLGKNRPSRTPRMMATMIRGNSPILVFFTL